MSDKTIYWPIVRLIVWHVLTLKFVFNPDGCSDELIRAYMEKHNRCTHNWTGHYYVDVDRQRVTDHDGKEMWFDSGAVCKYCLKPHHSVKNIDGEIGY